MVPEMPTSELGKHSACAPSLHEEIAFPGAKKEVRFNKRKSKSMVNFSMVTSKEMVHVLS